MTPRCGCRGAAARGEPVVCVGPETCGTGREFLATRCSCDKAARRAPSGRRPATCSRGASISLRLKGDTRTGFGRGAAAVARLDACLWMAREAETVRAVAAPWRCGGAPCVIACIGDNESVTAAHARDMQARVSRRTDPSGGADMRFGTAAENQHVRAPLE